MSKRTPVGLGLIAALLALGMLAFGASSASATIVKPANQPVTATNVAGTTTNFISSNAYAETSIRCEEAEATLTTPTTGIANNNNNQNRTEIGTFSESAGSVTMELTDKPLFEKCGVYTWNGTEWEFQVGANVTTNETNGEWTFAALGNVNLEEQAIAAVGVPKSGAAIAIPALGCTVDVSPTQSSVVTAKYFNNLEELRVDGQIKFGGNCPLVSPAQFEGRFDMQAAEMGPFFIGQ